MRKYLLMLCIYVGATNLIIGQCPISNSCTPGTASESDANLFLGGIFNVTLNGINKTSNGYADGFQDYSCSDSAVLNIGQNYNISINTGSNINQSVKVWVDLDNNGVFNASTELIYSSASGQTHSGSFILPNGTVSNTPLRMRVSSDWDASPAPTPCSTPHYGQVEDYKIVGKPNTNPPIADFEANELISCTGVIDFTDLSTNIPTEWKWYFGDGDSSIQQNPTHTYTIGGTYNVTLMASNFNGTDTEIKTSYITYNSSSPIAPSCTPSTISYCCDYGIYQVEVGTINNSSSNASVGYEDFSCTQSTELTEGTPYTVKVKTGPTLPQDTKVYIDLNNDGIFNETTELIETVIGQKSPTFSIKIPSGGMLDTPLRMRIISESEGTPINSCSDVSKGQCEDYTVKILENPNPPIALFEVDAQVKCDSLFQFTNNSENNIDSVFWDFGDDTYSNEISPLHSYQNNGTYSVTMKVFNKFGSDSVSFFNYIVRNTKAKEACPVSSGGGGGGNVGIKNFIFENVINNTATENDNSYKDYTCEYTVEVESDKNYNVTVYTGNDVQEQVKIFIDWNNDGVLNETTELVYDVTAFTNHVAPIYIPSNSQLVTNTKLRMRVMSGGKFGPNGFGGVEGPCDNIQGGEVEDYGIIIDKEDGILDSFKKTEFKIYPNPTNNAFSITNEYNKRISEIRIYNTMGTLVYSKNIENSSNLTFSPELDKGLYLVELTNGTEKNVQKLIIR